MLMKKKATKTLKFYSGKQATAADTTKTQYWNPYSTADTYLTAVNIPASDNLPAVDDNSEYTTEEAMNKIREVVSELEKHGIKIKTDEMNFDKSYQIIIKIDKNRD